MGLVKKILSTKKLSEQQYQLLQNFEVEVIELIEIDFNTEIQNTNIPKIAVFTSKNAVLSLFEKYNLEELQIKKVYCVGNKTAKILEEKGIEVAVRRNSAKELADEISKDKTINEVFFYCGNLRRNELPEILAEKQIKVYEVEVYKTHFKPVKIEKVNDGILFFSPSSVKSFMKKNNNTRAIAFCIGNTTASEAINYFETVFVAEEPTVENVIKSVNQYFDYE